MVKKNQDSGEQNGASSFVVVIRWCSCGGPRMSPLFSGGEWALNKKKGGLKRGWSKVKGEGGFDEEYCVLI